MEDTVVLPALILGQVIRLQDQTAEVVVQAHHNLMISFKSTLNQAQEWDLYQATHKVCLQQGQLTHIPIQQQVLIVGLQAQPVPQPPGQLHLHSRGHPTTSQPRLHSLGRPQVRLCPQPRHNHLQPQ